MTNVKCQIKVSLRDFIYNVPKAHIHLTFLICHLTFDVNSMEQIILIGRN